jgi:hypothetical protein
MTRGLLADQLAEIITGEVSVKAGMQIEVESTLLVNAHEAVGDKYLEGAEKGKVQNEKLGQAVGRCGGSVLFRERVMTWLISDGD